MDISVAVHDQKELQPPKRLSSAIVVMSLLQQLNHMDVMPVSVLVKLLNIVIEADARKGMQCLEVPVKNKESRLEVNDTVIISHCHLKASCI